MLWTDLRILIVDTGRVWWRLLPMIMGVYLLGWLGSELTLRVAVIAGDISPWLALVLFAFNFVCVLGLLRSRPPWLVFLRSSPSICRRS